MKKYNNQTVIFDHLNADKDNFIAVVGPCSVQSRNAARLVANELLAMQQRVDSRCLIVMRVYIDKPRSCLGWRGLLYSNPREAALTILECSDMLPVAVEIVDPYVMDTILARNGSSIDMDIALPTIGARTSESQLHRVAASNWKCAVGIKNPMDGDMAAFAAGCRAVMDTWNTVDTHHDNFGCTITTSGNEQVIGIWRGHRGEHRPGQSLPDYSSIRKHLVSAGLDDTPMIVDLNHGNAKALQNYVCISNRQKTVLKDAVAVNTEAGHSVLRGFMAEGHIEEGQSMHLDQDTMSITDYCNSLAQIEEMINIWK